MGKLEELINKLCPNGVEFKTLGELGKFYGGLTGKSKEDFNKGNAKFITYKNVYENLALKIDVEDRVNVGENEKQRTLEYGDIIFTGSSETSDECGISSVLTQKTEEKLYLNSFCFFLRLNDKNLLNPDFTKHLFRSSNLRYQIGKTASGVTRFNVSKKAMEKVCIPVPPLEVQCEIVRILDNFTLLSAELSAELSARQKQYEYYKKSLIDNNTSKEIPLKDIIKKSCSGGTPLKSKKEFYENGSIPWLRTQEVKFNEIYEISGRITEEAIKFTSAKWIPENCIIVAMSGASAGRCAINKIETTTNQHCLNLEIDDSKALYKYVFYCVCSKYDELIAKKEGARGDLNSSKILNLKIPLPPLKEQERIVNILDRFDKLCNNLSEGLPAEIEARKKQYEYYRDKLLTFKELK
ncbi:restriction endonuclease subunit S [Campylobacter lanienae]|uniref:restriction endonuclease subunit S n=1 Tax=Campylobacter lanienae TaxID=75658 RepID=UPI000BB44110|nr:restriction endonuclease subunit S [Campylobacter lanienae]